MQRFFQKKNNVESEYFDTLIEALPKIYWIVTNLPFPLSQRGLFEKIMSEMDSEVWETYILTVYSKFGSRLNFNTPSQTYLEFFQKKWMLELNSKSSEAQIVTL